LFAVRDVHRGAEHQITRDGVKKGPTLSVEKSMQRTTLW
jgi:hypothetical protein